MKKLKASLRDLVAEYLSSGDVSEADRALREFHVPSFHFGFVKIVIDEGKFFHFNFCFCNFTVNF